MWWVAILLCLAVGCGRRTEEHPPAARRIAVMGSMTEAGRAAPALPQPESVPTDSVSAVTFPSLEAARDAVERLLRQAVDLSDTAVHVSRDTVTFEYWYAKSIARGWVVRAVVNDTSGCPVDPLHSALLARGWVMVVGYEADGDDGTVQGLRSRDILCVIEGRWDGGDPTDSTYVPKPGCTVTATLVPLRQDDVPR